MVAVTVPSQLIVDGSLNQRVLERINRSSGKPDRVESAHNVWYMTESVAVKVHRDYGVALPAGKTVLAREHLTAALASRDLGMNAVNTVYVHGVRVGDNILYSLLENLPLVPLHELSDEPSWGKLGRWFGTTSLRERAETQYDVQVAKAKTLGYSPVDIGRQRSGFAKGVVYLSGLESWLVPEHIRVAVDTCFDSKLSRAA